MRVHRLKEFKELEVYVDVVGFGTEVHTFFASGPIVFVQVIHPKSNTNGFNSMLDI